MNIIIALLYCCSLFLSQSKGSLLKTKVCVIGAGPTGISAIRHLSANLEKFDVVVFEKANEIGGQWLYTDRTGVDEYNNLVHSSIYRYLRTNGAKESTDFPDWPIYHSGNESFVPHKIIQDYLKNYTNHFHLRPFIQFNTMVLNVSLTQVNKLDRWNLMVKNLKTNNTQNHICDAVIVCNGHFFKPKVPKIPGLEDFKGQVLHSHSYRDPEKFRNRTTIVLGAGTSGLDISKELLDVTSTVYLSHNHPLLPISKPKQVKGVEKFVNGKFVLKDNSTISADLLIFCTGYKYSYPFLDESSGIKIKDQFVTPLYKHMINIEHPSMIFLGIPNGPFSNLPLFHLQAQYMVSVLEGKTKLPSKLEMLKDSEITSKSQNNLGYEEAWKYLDELTSLENLPSIPKYYKILNVLTFRHFVTHMDNFRNFKLVLSPDKSSAEYVELNKPL